MDCSISHLENFHEFLFKTPKLTKDIAETFCNSIRSCLHQESKNIIINLSKVSSIDTDVLNTLIRAKRKTNQENGSFILVADNDKMINILQAQNLPEPFVIVPTQSEAFDYIQMEELERELGGLDI